MPKTIRPRLLVETIGDVTVIGFAEQAPAWRREGPFGRLLII